MGMHKQRLTAGLAVLFAAGLATGTTIDPKRMASSNAVEPAAATPAAAKNAPSDGAPEPLLSQDGYQEYMVAVLRAELLKDPVKRCLAYPDLPGNEWPKAMVEGLCALVPKEGSLDELDDVLKQPAGGAELDRRYAALLDAHYADPKKKDRIFRAYDIFDESPHAAAVAEEWVRQSPDSAYARTARAWQLVQSGWDAGAKYNQGGDAKRSLDLFARSLPDLDFALKQNPKLLPACDRLISIGNKNSGLLQEIGSQQCLKADPASYRVMASLLWANQPKWGGSQALMRELVAMARAQESSNPTLAALRNYQAGYDAAEDRSHDHWAKTAPVLERIMLVAPGYSTYASRAMLNLDRSWDNFVYASQALRFNPEDGDAYYDRAFALRNLNMLELALADARLATRFRTHDGWPEYEMSVILERLTRYEESRAHALKAMDDPDTRGIANELLCRSYWFTQEFATMTTCTEQLVIDFPASDEAWRLRAVAYKDSNNPKVYDAVDDFLERAHSDAQANEITWFKGWRVEHPRPASRH
jgi:hypothetical protein